MRRKLPGWLAWTVLGLLFLVASGLASAASFSQLYIFGDSLSNTGNAAAVVGGLAGPYYQHSRFSNGPVAVEVLAQKLKLRADPSGYLLGQRVGTNYAVGGAQARGHRDSDLSAQIGGFLAHHHYNAPADALYVIIIGGNDVREARNEPTTAGAEHILDAAVAVVTSHVRTLLLAGARAFLVTDSPDIGLTPETRQLAEVLGKPAFIRRATALSGTYALKLKDGLHQLEEESRLNLPYFSLFTLTRLLKPSVPLFGITHTQEACFSSQRLTFTPNCHDGANVDQFAFFDEGVVLHFN